MKSRLLLLSAILAATAGVSTAQSSQPDAQAQAAAVLSPSHVVAPESTRTSSQSAGGDAQAQAAALLSGVRAEQGANASVRIAPSGAAQSLDAQAHAAALLSGSRTTANEDVQTTAQSAETLGDHPAVIAARAWNTRRIDPNTFIVAHPARLQLLAASPTENDAQRAAIQAAAATKVSGAAGQ
jgi:hypothetical protein